jgi:hypothetical protein
MREAERTARIAWRNPANNSGVERNFTFGPAEHGAVGVMQQPACKLRVPSAKNDAGVVRLPHMRAAR